MTTYRECPCCGASAKWVHTKWLPRLGRVQCKKCGLQTRYTYRAVAERLWSRRFLEQLHIKKEVQP